MKEGAKVKECGSRESEEREGREIIKWRRATPKEAQRLNRQAEDAIALGKDSVREDTRKTMRIQKQGDTHRLILP